MKKVLLVFLMLLLVFSFAGCGGGGAVENDDFRDEMPQDLSAFVDAELSIVRGIGEMVHGEWAESHDQLMLEGGGQENPLYWELKEVLDTARIQFGAYYVYAMITDGSGDYFITVDGSEEPDDWLENYGYEVQFEEAYNGFVASARSGWDDDVPMWSCFAPVFDSDNNIVAIVGVDMPCPILENYPEWNRDRDEWNGIEE